MHDVAPLAKHPAPYSGTVLAALRRAITVEQKRLGRPVLLLDPFAGVGRIHQLSQSGKVRTVGVEIEPEWAACHQDTIVGDALHLPTNWRNRFDLVVTSPVYGNRMSDYHQPAASDTSTRRGYGYDLGRRPSVGSSATLKWGPAYWAFHVAAYREMFRVLAPGGMLLLNVSNFIQRGAEVHAVDWHLGATCGVGFDYGPPAITVKTPRMRKGRNHEARVEGEAILRMRKPL